MRVAMPSPTDAQVSAAAASGVGALRAARARPTTENHQCPRAAMEAKGADAWQPAEERSRQVSAALWAYAAMTTSADKGAVRDISQLRK